MFEFRDNTGDVNSVTFTHCFTSCPNILFLNQGSFGCTADNIFTCRYCTLMCPKVCKHGGCEKCHSLDLCHEDEIRNCDCKTDEVDEDGKYIICKECGQRIGKKG